MIKHINFRIVLGIILILAGTGALLQTTGMLAFTNTINTLLVAVFFGIIGLLFLGLLINGRSNWWAVFPGAGLIALGALIGLGILMPQFTWAGGSLFLGFLGLAFWIVYATNSKRWWAIIPGGVLMTLAMVALGDHFVMIDSGTLFFLGLAATFGLLYVLPTGPEKMNWAWIPASVMLALAALTSGFSARNANFLWPVVLIAIGLLFAFRAIRSH